MITPTSLFVPHAGFCNMCKKLAESPRIQFINWDLNDRIRICSDRCLARYYYAEQQFKNAKKGQIEIHKPAVRENRTVQLQPKEFKDDMKLEDIEDLDLSVPIHDGKLATIKEEE